MSCCLLCEEDREENSLEVTSAWHENNQLVSSQTYQTAKYSTRPDPGEHFFANPECKNNLPKQATSCQASNQRDRLNQRQSDYCRSHYKQHIQRKKRNGTEKHKKNCQNKFGTICELDQEPIDLVLQGKIEKQAPTSEADSYSSLLLKMTRVEIALWLQCLSSPTTNLTLRFSFEGNWRHCKKWTKQSQQIEWILKM